MDGVLGELSAVGEVAADADGETGFDAVGVAQRGQSGGVGAADVVGAEPPAEVCAPGRGLGDPVRGGVVPRLFEGAHRSVGVVAVDDDGSEQRVGRMLDVAHRQCVVAAHPVLAAVEVVRRVRAGCGSSTSSAHWASSSSSAPALSIPERVPQQDRYSGPTRRAIYKIIRVRRAKPYQVSRRSGALAGPTGYLIPRNGDS